MLRLTWWALLAFIVGVLFGVGSEVGRTLVLAVVLSDPEPDEPRSTAPMCDCRDWM